MTGTTGTGDDVQLTPLNLFLVTLRLPDEAQEDPIPEPAATSFLGLDMQTDGGLNMQSFPD